LGDEAAAQEEAANRAVQEDGDGLDVGRGGRAGVVEFEGAI